MNNNISGELIKRKREELGLTQLQLSKKLNVFEKTISKWETKRGLPDIGILEKLSEVLQVSVQDLLNGKEEKMKILMQI